MKKTIILASFGFLFLATAVTTAARSNFFSDVHVADWFYGYVETVRSWGVISGNDDGTFAPARNINRAEFAKMLTLYDQRVDRKIASVDNSSEGRPVSVMSLEKFNEIPAECPTGWEEANYGINWEEGGRSSRRRTCYTTENCSVMHLEIFNEVPKKCLAGWTEADYGEKWAEGGRVKWYRTCYICS